MVRLDLREAVAGDQASTRLFDIGRCADKRDDLVDVVEGDDEALEDVRTLFSLPQAVLRPPDDHLDLVRDVLLDDLADVQSARDAVHDRQHVHAEVVLELRALVERVENHLRHRALLEVDDQPHPLARRLVAQVSDPLETAGLGVHELGDLLRQASLVDLVRQLGHDDPRVALGPLFDLADGAHLDRTAAGRIGVVDPLPAEDQSARREVRPLDVFHDRSEHLVGVFGKFRLLEHLYDRVDDLAEVVRRDVRGHADSDTGRAVDEQVGEPRGQNGRLEILAVVVGREVDGLLADVAQQLHRKPRQPTLGVVANEAIRDEGVVIAVDPERVHGLDTRIFDGGYLGEVVLPADQRLDHGLYFIGADVLEDLLPVTLPALDPVDVVLDQPLPLLPRPPALLADVVGEVGHVIRGHRTAGQRDRLEITDQFLLLLAEEAHSTGEEAEVAPVTDVDLDLPAVRNTLP